MLFVGVDASLRQTGLAAVDHDGKIIKSDAVSIRQERGAARLRKLRDEAALFFGRLSGPVVAAAFEGFSVDSVNRPYDLGEAAGVLKVLVLDTWKIEPLVVAPTQLKKFATGHGHADKAAIVYCVKQRWGYDAATDDEADAIVLAMIARCWHMKKFTTRAEAEVVYALSSPAQKKRPGARAAPTINV